jgi:hypothetical protein
MVVMAMPVMLGEQSLTVRRQLRLVLVQALADITGIGEVTAVD